MTQRPITFDGHVIGHTSGPVTSEPEPVHVPRAHDMGMALAHELIYLDRATPGQEPKIVVGTDLLNAVIGFTTSLALRMPSSDFDRIRTDCRADLADHVRLLRSAGAHLLATADALLPGHALLNQPALQVQAQLAPQGQPPEALQGEGGQQPAPGGIGGAATDAPPETKVTLTGGASFLSTRR